MFDRVAKALQDHLGGSLIEEMSRQLASRPTFNVSVVSDFLRERHIGTTEYVWPPQESNRPQEVLRWLEEKRAQTGVRSGLLWTGADPGVMSVMRSNGHWLARRGAQTPEDPRPWVPLDEVLWRQQRQIEEASMPDATWYRGYVRLWAIGPGEASSGNPQHSEPTATGATRNVASRLVDPSFARLAALPLHESGLDGAEEMVRELRKKVDSVKTMVDAVRNQPVEKAGQLIRLAVTSRRDGGRLRTPF